MASVTWIDALNEQAEWQSAADLRKWLSAIFARSLNPSDLAVLEFAQTLNFMRLELGKCHFQLPIDLHLINRRLENAGRLIVADSVAETSRLPHLHYVAETASDDALLKAFEQTLFLQFTHFIAEFLDPASAPVLARCEGLFRPDANRDCFDQIEARFRAEIPLLVEANMVDDPEIERCGDLFFIKGKAKYCSDACRFSTFQINKQIKDPSYLAEKQRRYRQKPARS